MATLRRGRALIALGALALIPAALVGCGSDDSGSSQSEESTTEETTTEEETTAESSDQSVADACGIVVDGLTGLSSSTSEIMAALGEGDSEQINTLAGELNEQISALNEQVTNDEVSAVFSKFADNYDTIITISEEASADPASAADKMSELTAASEELQTANTELQDVCA
ncbi:hypothetical protein [Microbacterium halotolerans]|uniref:hypothetical protein n=1 Tax=Microbacterium halotolerans TaxID=246613 RepID=UPI000E6AA781|nr:hypothetical protein [Microbacterium halotolerans]